MIILSIDAACIILQQIKNLKFSFVAFKYKHTNIIIGCFF